MLKRNIKFLSILLTLLLLLSGFNSDKPSIYVIPVNGEINTATYKFIKDSTNSLDLKTDDVVIFEIDTYGGLISDRKWNTKSIEIALQIGRASCRERV